MRTISSTDPRGDAAKVQELTDGQGAEAVIDFVGEGTAIQEAVGMLKKGGIYWVVGYGGMVEVPAIDMIFSEIAVMGSLVGNYNELAELMTMAGQGRVSLTGVEYKLDDINTAIHDLHHGQTPRPRGDRALIGFAGVDGVGPIHGPTGPWRR